jgi:hypothetical protein
MYCMYLYNDQWQHIHCTWGLVMIDDTIYCLESLVMVQRIVWEYFSKHQYWQMKCCDWRICHILQTTCFICSLSLLSLFTCKYMMDSNTLPTSDFHLCPVSSNIEFGFIYLWFIIWVLQKKSVFSTSRDPRCRVHVCNDIQNQFF